MLYQHFQLQGIVVHPTSHYCIIYSWEIHVNFCLLFIAIFWGLPGCLLLCLHYLTMWKIAQARPFIVLNPPWSGSYINDHPAYLKEQPNSSNVSCQGKLKNWDAAELQLSYRSLYYVAYGMWILLSRPSVQQAAGLTLCSLILLLFS